MGYGKRLCNRRHFNIFLLICFCSFIITSLILHGHLDFDPVKPTQLNKPRQTQYQCTYSTCFNITRCAYEYPENALHKIGIFIYPIHEDWDLHYSNEFITILNIIRSSQYYVSDPQKACLFIPNVDLLNGFDKDFGRSLHVLAELLRQNNNGSNNLLFNFIWNENLQYIDMSVLASAGYSLQTYRPTFDISLPAYNPLIGKSIQDRLLGTDSRFLLTIFPESEQHRARNLEFLLASYRNPYFKSNQTIIMLHDCNNATDSYFTRCAQVSSSQYLPPVRQTVQYPWILSRSLFCLITRASHQNRLALFDIMASNCIPVIADDNFLLPFSEILDWTRIAIRIRKDQFEKIPSILTDYSVTEILQFQKQVNFIFKRYFSSLDKIVLTTLDILNDRVYPYYAKSYSEWNNPDYLQTYLPTPPVLFYPLRVQTHFGYTALIRGQDHFGTLCKLLLQLHRAPLLHRIVIVWTNPSISSPDLSLWPSLDRPLLVIPAANDSVNGRFYPYQEINTEAVLSLDENIYLPSVIDIEHAFELWSQHPDRLITVSRSQSVSTSDPLVAVLGSVSFFHKHYLHLYQEFLSNSARSLIKDLDCCENYFLNWLIVQTSGQPVLNINASSRPITIRPKDEFATITGDKLIKQDRCLLKLSQLESFTKPIRTDYYSTQILTLNVDSV